MDISDEKLQKLGKMSSYGIIKGTNLYFGSYSKGDDESIIDYGYCFEEAVLELNSHQIGTCWLGGTFGRSFISDALSLPIDYVVPAISPVGLIADKKSFTDKLVRKIAKAAKRKSYQELFFEKNKEGELLPLFENDISSNLKIILDGIRVAPSASNKQPWRVIVNNRTINIYWEKDEKYNGTSKGFNIQALDMGITICHIEKVLNDLSIDFEFKNSDPGLGIDKWIYIGSCNF